MLDTVTIMCILVIIDLSLLTLMSKFHINLGIPLYVKTVKLKTGKGVNDIIGFVRLTDNLKYKVKGNSIIYRTKFNIINLYTLLFITIVKGEFSINDGKLKIVQRMNLTTTFFIGLLIYINLTQQLDNFGRIATIIIIALIIAASVLRNKNIKELKNEIENSVGVDGSF